MWIRDCCCLVAKCVRLSQPPWTVARQALLSMGFPRQEYWRRLPFPSLEDLPAPGIEPGSPVLAGDSLLLSHQGSPWIRDTYAKTHSWLTEILLRMAGTAAPFFFFFFNKIKWQNKVHLAFPGPVLPLTSSFRTTPSPDSLFSSSPWAGFFIAPRFWAPRPAPGQAQVLGLLFFLYLIQ